MWRCFVFFGLIQLASGQMLLAPESRQAREIAQYFEKGADAIQKDAGKLNCVVRPYPARLSYNFQYWTGYDIIVPVNQFAKAGRDRPMAIALQVTPQDTSKIKSFLYARAGFPRRIPPQFWATKGVEMNLGGGFIVGPGKYTVALLVADSIGRICRKTWNVEAKSLGLPTQIASGEVGESGMDAWKGIVGGTGKVSILVHAAPMMRRRIMTKLSAWDRNILLNSLRSLLDVGGFAQARVTVFDFDGRRVLFESENFGGAEYERLMGVLMELSFGTVSVKTLQGPDEGAFLEEVMRKEVAQASASDAVVFMGPPWRWGQKLSPLLREQRSQLPSVYYVALTPWVANTTDLIEKFVKAGPKGRVLTVFQPQDLAKAVREIRDKKNVIQ